MSEWRDVVAELPADDDRAAALRVLRKLVGEARVAAPRDARVDDEDAGEAG